MKGMRFISPTSMAWKGFKWVPQHADKIPVGWKGWSWTWQIAGQILSGMSSWRAAAPEHNTSLSSSVSLNSLRSTGFRISLRKEVGNITPQKSYWVMDLLGQMPAIQTTEKNLCAAIHILVQITRKRNIKKPKEKQKKFENWVPVLTVGPLNPLQLSKTSFQDF